MDGPSGPPYRLPRKSSSFLSLRREKEKSSASVDSHPPTFDSPGPSNRRRPSYFDAYPRAKTTTNGFLPKIKGRRRSPTHSPSRSASARHDQSEKSGNGKTPTETSYVFPSFDSIEDLSIPATPKPYARTRSRTGPSQRSNWEDASIHQLRFSGSSSTQHTETPPRTPVDINPSGESFEHFPVVVAAPISGVETMDALVDGMNGRDDMLSGASISSRARFGIPGHHPLYQPPLPTPPPGVVLGGGKMRRKSNPPTIQSSDSEDGDSHLPVATRSRRRRPRHHVQRTASDSTVSPIPSITRASPQEVSSLTFPHEVATLRRPVSPSDKRKSIVPSISEIIRSHGPPESHVRPRPPTARSSSLYAHSQGHATVHEEPESEPEPLDPQEEAEMISRSSIDSVADEVQRTLRNQIAIKPPPSAPPSSFPKRHSTTSDNASIYSPRSDPGVGSSIYASSIASYHPPPSPFDTASFISLSKPTSASQEVAQYLRSSRLTTLLKLTRSPHASHDNPLTVSLSDLGCPTGHPVVVFLGLGCVRHIMGLYDEMAECLNLRLITIDRYVN